MQECWTLVAPLNVNLHPLIRKLESIGPVADDEKQAIVGLPMVLRDLEADQDIVREQDPASQCCLILDGFACRYKILPSGKRQIFSFHIPGDIPDLQTLHLQVMDHNLGTLVPSKVALISHETVRVFLRAHLRIADVLWRDTLVDAAIYREWMAGIGRRDAHARIAHLLCELFLRLKAVGLTHGDAYEMPITQVELADSLGLSAVHVNRTLQQLRRSGIISTSREKVVVRNWNKLQEAGEFDPTYLHLKKSA
jgi:CRP-like cAMP-binding protein